MKSLYFILFLFSFNIRANAKEEIELTVHDSIVIITSKTEAIKLNISLEKKSGFSYSNNALCLSDFNKYPSFIYSIHDTIDFIELSKSNIGLIFSIQNENGEYIINPNRHVSYKYYEDEAKMINSYLVVDEKKLKVKRIFTDTIAYHREHSQKIYFKENILNTTIFPIINTVYLKKGIYYMTIYYANNYSYDCFKGHFISNKIKLIVSK